MTNYERYKEQIENLVRLGIRVAVTNDNKEVKSCEEVRCVDCLFNEKDTICDYKKLKWADAEYIEPEGQVDWSKVPVDTPILVSDDNKCWYRSHFAQYNSEDHQVLTWCKGRTSWSINYDGAYLVSNREAWKYAKLAEVDNGI